MSLQSARLLSATSEIITAAGSCLNDGIQTVGRPVAWMGRQVQQYAIHPLCAAAKQLAAYASTHKAEIATNFLAWGLILVFCGAMHGFKTVSLPMLIGLAPGLVLGGIGGMLAAKAFISEGNQESGLIHRTIKKFNSVPAWTRNLLVALSASAYITACMIIPYGTGAMAGVFFGGMLGYAASNYDPTRPPPEPIEARLNRLEQTIQAMQTAAGHVRD
jgi:hypothetical protein